jgi:hypothetical protein
VFHFCLFLGLTGGIILGDLGTLSVGLPRCGSEGGFSLIVEGTFSNAIV